MNPAVSIIICVYNGERHLANTLHSALAQTFADFELIAVDDGSRDGSAALLDATGDPRVRVIRQANSGTAGALATGLNAARGHYIAFLDQDDLWAPDSLAAHVELLDARPEIDLSFSWFRVIDDAGQDIGVHSVRYEGAVTFEELMMDFVIGGSSNVVTRRAALDRAGGVDLAFPRMYDLDLFLRIALLRPHNVAAIPRDLMLYRRHGKQISRDSRPLREEWSRCLDKMRALAPAEVARAELRAQSNMHRYFARIAYEDELYGDGLSLMREAFLAAPGPFLTDRRNWLTAAACVSGALLPTALHQRLEHLAGLRRELRSVVGERDITLA